MAALAVRGAQVRIANRGTLERGNRGWTSSKHKEGIDDGRLGMGGEKRRARETWIFKRRINNVMAPGEQ